MAGAAAVASGMLALDKNELRWPIVRYPEGGYSMIARLALAVMVAVGGAGCFGLRAIDRDPAEVTRCFTWRGGPNWYAYQVRLDGDHLFGPDVEVSRVPEGYPDHVGGVYVDLKVQGPEIVGWVGWKRTHLQVDELADGLAVTGLYAGHWGRLELCPDRLSGAVGGYRYDLHRSDRGTRWYRTRGAELALPEDLFRRPAADRAVLLALLLGGRPHTI
jgi:hypothetical protein